MKKYVIYDFDSKELVTTTVYDSHEQAREDADQLQDVMVIPLDYDFEPPSNDGEFFICEGCGSETPVKNGAEPGARCPECGNWFCQKCYDPGKGDGCKRHQPAAASSQRKPT